MPIKQRMVRKIVIMSCITPLSTLMMNLAIMHNDDYAQEFSAINIRDVARMHAVQY